jgi:hypothetical protein
MAATCKGNDLATRTDPISESLLQIHITRKIFQEY